MKYDLIVVGGGPGGLMAAKTAAEDGLKVILVERKRNITEINRACSQIFYVRKITGTGESETGKTKSDGYIEPVSVEIAADKTRFHFDALGISVDYTGALRPYLNWIQLSPSGKQINRYKLNDQPWGFYYDKEAFVSGLLASVEKAGVEVWPETIGLGAENIKGGVKVRVQAKSGEQTLEARAAIAADGLQSKIVDSLGINQKRRVLGSRQRVFVQYVMEGIETGLPDSSWLTWTIPSINIYGFIAIGLSAENTNKLGAPSRGDLSAETVLDGFMKYPKWAHMFRKARVVKKEGVGRSGTMFGPIREPVAGNVVIVGDAGAIAETWTQGAVASAYQAVKAIKKELDGRKGYPEYIAWWQQAFAFNTPNYLKLISNMYPLSRICSDEEIDYIYELFQGKIGVPQLLVANHMELIKKGRPELYQKLIKSRM
jgi:digeranylgeranylglycerophospholipid reductase